MKRHTPKLVLALTLTALSVQAAMAAEIVLFEQPFFSGRQVELQDYTPNVSAIGFNDQTSSVVVRSGRWEVCSDNNFNGFCATLERGQYRNLDPRLNNKISSVREVGSTAGRGDNRNDITGSVELFNQRNFGGRSMRLERSVEDFSQVALNDRATSVIVTEGTWVLCTDTGYRGTCRTYAPGRYADLGPGMKKTISSARMVEPSNDYQPRHRGGWDRGNDNANQPAVTPIAMYENENMQGRSLAVAANIVDMAPIGFNDATESMVIASGHWEFCSDSYFRGQCRVMGPGTYKRLDPAMIRSISSVRSAAATPPAPAVRYGADMFTEANFGGTRVMVNSDMYNFNAGGMNDRFSSVVVHAGTWEICLDSNYRGGCTTFGPGRYANLGGLTKQVSSMRRLY